MKVRTANFGNNRRTNTLRAFAIVFIFSFSFSFKLLAQEADSTISDSLASESSTEISADGPSLENISKNLASSAKELEKIRNEEILSYIYMGLGFSVVIAIAWFTTVLARKRKRKEDEIRAIRAQNMKHHKPHHPHHPKR